jgi:hypothetical protein
MALAEHPVTQQCISSICRAPEETAQLVSCMQLPKHRKVKLFRVEVLTHRTDWMVTHNAPLPKRPARTIAAARSSTARSMHWAR